MDGYGGEVGSLSIDYRILPANDRFANPKTSFPALGSTLWATREAGEPVAVPEASGGANSIWFQYTATANTLVSVRRTCTGLHTSGEWELLTL